MGENAMSTIMVLDMLPIIVTVPVCTSTVPRFPALSPIQSLEPADAGLAAMISVTIALIKYARRKRARFMVHPRAKYILNLENVAAYRRTRFDCNYYTWQVVIASRIFCNLG